jgi:hypothetical protein
MYIPIEKEMLKFTLSLNQEDGMRSDRQRQILVSSFKNTIDFINASPNFENDSNLRLGVRKWMNTGVEILEIDYPQLEALRSKAQLSPIELKQYLAFKEKLRRKFQESSSELDDVTERFANKNGLTTVSEETRFGKRLAQANAALDYYDEVYVLFFFPKHLDKRLNAAVNSKDPIKIKMARLKLEETCQNSASSLQKQKSFREDESLKKAAIRMVNSFEKTAKEYGWAAEEMFELEFKYDSLKKAVVEKPANERTNEEIQAYNSTVSRYNTKVQEFNLITREFNLFRQKELAAWNNAVNEFVEKHVR